MKYLKSLKTEYICYLGLPIYEKFKIQIKHLSKFMVFQTFTMFLM